MDSFSNLKELTLRWKFSRISSTRRAVSVCSPTTDGGVRKTQKTAPIVSTVASATTAQIVLFLMLGLPV